jgi:hypothetical protein
VVPKHEHVVVNTFLLQAYKSVIIIPVHEPPPAPTKHRSKRTSFTISSTTTAARACRSNSTDSVGGRPKASASDRITTRRMPVTFWFLIGRWVKAEGGGVFRVSCVC